MKKIAVVTGTRAEYGYLKPLMQAIENEPTLQLIPIVTGMHLQKEFGDSQNIVKKDFPQATQIQMPLLGDQLKDMAHYLSSGIKNIADYLSQNTPDIIIVLGDRTESLAAALSALILNIPIAHINGGDVTGTTIDESIRHAITKIAHIHFAHTKNNAERIKKMGEEKHRIYITGALTNDTILNKTLPTKKEIFSKYNLDRNKPTFLVVQHPITTLKDKGYSHLQQLLLALDELKNQTIMIYPNCDAGGKQFIQLIEKYRKKKYTHIYKNLPHEDYLSIMKTSDIMIGNSSSGMIEAPSFKIPVINIGTRQQGRERSNNIIDVKPEKHDILHAIHYALNEKKFLEKIKTTKNIYGKGNAAQKIVNILKDLHIDESLIQKQITY